MKKHYPLIALLILVLASLACQTVLGGGEIPTQVDFSTPPPVDNGNNNDNSDDSTGGGFDTSDAGFPIPPDATDVTDMGETLLTFQTDMSLEEAMDFYRDELGKEGYTERTILTTTSDSTFSFVFDGHTSGKALVIQGVDFGGSVTVSLSLQDV